MQAFDLIDYVVPRGGIYNVVGMKKVGRYQSLPIV
jgi:hypothetical protein